MREALRSWLPVEHGVWGLLAAAALVGLPLGSGLAGVPLLAAATVAVLLRARWRAAPAWRPGLVAGAAAAGLLVLAWAMAPDAGFAGWLLAGAVPGGAALAFRRRSAWASLLAACAFACLGAAVAAAGGAPAGWCVLAAAVLAVHLALLVPLVRAQVRPDPRWGRLAVDAHVLALCGAAGAWAAGIAPSVIPLIFGIGLARCALLVDNRTSMSNSSPARIGAREMAWLPMVAGALALALRGGWA